ncbi:MAG TPA: hypothetical protein VNI54_12595 [Thermoanaerobaculia bacterium]|nr:hypothetical protein [Thermoanaerobaculia bacterium]
MITCALFFLMAVLWFGLMAALLWSARKVWEGEVGPSRVRVRNSVFNEQMFVDGVLVAQQSGLSFFVDLRAQTPIGGQPVNLHAHIGGWFSVDCTLTADGRPVPLLQLPFDQ